MQRSVSDGWRCAWHIQYTRASQLMFNCEIIYFLSTNNMSNGNEVTIQCMYKGLGIWFKWSVQL